MILPSLSVFVLQLCLSLNLNNNIYTTTTHFLSLSSTFLSPSTQTYLISPIHDTCCLLLYPHIHLPTYCNIYPLLGFHSFGRIYIHTYSHFFSVSPTFFHHVTRLFCPSPIRSICSYQALYVAYSPFYRVESKQI